METNDIKLMTITELLGLNFYIPEYQRGYRWTKRNVEQLLNDIWEYRNNTNNANHFYCLQPLVVRARTWQGLDGETVEGYELIDGQQRLTTLHRIITYLCIHHIEGSLVEDGYGANLYNLYYKTRMESRAFLETEEIREDVPDLYYMSQAYTVIREWFENSQYPTRRHKCNKLLECILPSMTSGAASPNPEWSVKVIWYEIRNDQQDSEALFTRLNRGKIPLTSSELIKAKFVNSASYQGLSESEKVRRCTILVQQWDEIEQQLNNPRFWAFASNESSERYTNKIEYLFEIVARKSRDKQDPLYSFLTLFPEPLDAAALWGKWLEIEEIYQTLQYWYSNKDFYHQVGYLITTGYSVRDLIQQKRQLTKQDFKAFLVEKIRSSIPDDWEDLDYSKNRQGLLKVLLLVNVELTRKSTNIFEFFPFEWYKKEINSLEHIHSQNIEEIGKQKQERWITWLDSHLLILGDLASDKNQALELEGRIRELMQGMGYEQFLEWSEEILELLPRDDSDTDLNHLHSIENLALLGLRENQILSNSVFEVKRRKVVEMDREGAYIPPATKRVFLKYYAKGSDMHYAIWTKPEREAYLQEIENALSLAN